MSYTSLNEMFDFTVRIGYGKALCQFLNDKDLKNLFYVNTQCREIVSEYIRNRANKQNYLFDFTVRIGYGKALCQFLDSSDAANLALVNTQCREIIPVHRERWGFKPGFSENMWRHITVFFENQIYKTTFPVYNCKYYKCQKGNVISFRGSLWGQILDIVIPDEDLWIELIHIWLIFNKYENELLRSEQHSKNLKIYWEKQERLKQLKIKKDEERRREEVKRLCRVTNPWSKTQSLISQRL